MDYGTQEATYWSGFTVDALKVYELLVKLRYTEKYAKYIVGDGLDSGEKLEYLDNYMCNSFVKNCCNPGADQKGVVVSTMDEVFLKLFVWGMQHTKDVSRTIDIDIIVIEWSRGMNGQKKLEAAWTNTLSEKYYPKANLGDVPHTFEDIIAFLCKICGQLGIFLAYFVI